MLFKRKDKRKIASEGIQKLIMSYINRFVKLDTEDMYVTIHFLAPIYNLTVSIQNMTGYSEIYITKGILIALDVLNDSINSKSLVSLIKDLETKALAMTKGNSLNYAYMNVGVTIPLDDDEINAVITRVNAMLNDNQT